MGPEGHVASIFPDSPAVADERPVFAVRDCPKPPPTRVSLGFAAINAAEEVWLLVAGERQGARRRAARALAVARRRASPARRGARRSGHRVVAGCSRPRPPPRCRDHAGATPGRGGPERRPAD